MGIYIRPLTLLAAVSLFSVGGLCVKPLADLGMSPMAIAFYRGLIASLTLAALNGHHMDAMKEAVKSKWCWFGGFGLVFSTILLVPTLVFLPSGTAYIFFATTSIWVLILGRFFKKKTNLWSVFAIALTGIGVTIIAWDKVEISALKGVGFGLLFGFVGSFYLVAQDHTKNEHKQMVPILGNLLTFPVIAAILIIGGNQDSLRVPAAEAWIYLGVLGIFQYSIAMYLIAEVQKKTSGLTIGLSNTGQPVVASLLGLMFLGETIPNMELIGGALILAGVILSKLKS